jgi:protein-arginine kinase activator protein McsA
MFWLKRLALPGLVFSAALVLAGCQTSAAKSAAASTTQADGISCDKCKVTWVKTPTTGGKGRVLGYSRQKQMVCPDCKSAVENLFASGKFEHTCATCGGNMQACAVH